MSSSTIQSAGSSSSGVGAVLSDQQKKELLEKKDAEIASYNQQITSNNERIDTLQREILRVSVENNQVLTQLGWTLEQGRERLRHLARRTHLLEENIKASSNKNLSCNKIYKIASIIVFIALIVALIAYAIIRFKTI